MKGIYERYFHLLLVNNFFFMARKKGTSATSQEMEKMKKR